MNILIESKENLESSICSSHCRWRNGLLVKVWMEQAFKEVFEEGRWGAISGWTGQPYSLLKPHWQKGFGSGKATMQWGMNGSHISSTQQSKSHSHVCANSPAKEWGLLSPAQPSPQQEENHASSTPQTVHTILLFSLVSISSSLKEGY